MRETRNELSTHADLYKEKAGIFETSFDDTKPIHDQCKERIQQLESNIDTIQEESERLYMLQNEKEQKLEKIIRCSIAASKKLEELKLCKQLEDACRELQATRAELIKKESVINGNTIPARLTDDGGNDMIPKSNGQIKSTSTTSSSSSQDFNQTESNYDFSTFNVSSNEGSSTGVFGNGNHTINNHLTSLGVSTSSNFWVPTTSSSSSSSTMSTTLRSNASSPNPTIITDMDGSAAKLSPPSSSSRNSSGATDYNAETTVGGEDTPISSRSMST